METTKLSTKGQVILPKAIRDAYGWRPGMEFSLEDTGDGVLLRPLKRFAETRLEELVGCLKYDGPARSLEEMARGVAEEAKRHA